MRVTTSALAVIAVASGSTIWADARSYLPTTVVRSHGIRAIQKARNNFIDDRRLQYESDMNEMDMNDADMSAILGDFDMGEMMALMVPSICASFESNEFKQVLQDEGEAEGIACSQFGCDDPQAAKPNLVMNCKMVGEVCDESPDGHTEAGEQFCIADTDVQMSMGLDFAGKSKVESTQCSTYTSPQYMADMGRGCWTVDFSMHYGAMWDDAMSGEFDVESLAGDEAEEAVMKYFEITECSSEFDDGTTCTCSTCNGGTGFELSCTDDLVSEACTSVDASVGAGMTSMSESTAEGPSVSVIKLVATPDAGDVVKESDSDSAGADIKADGASSSASRTEAVAVVSLLLAFFSFVVTKY